MKAVCLCQGGNTRSVACGFVLKYSYGIDAIACGWEKNSPQTLEMLFNWADHIFIMQKEFEHFVPVDYHPKLHVIDVGPDVWFNSLHPDLISKVGTLLDPLTFCEREIPDFSLG